MMQAVGSPMRAQRFAGANPSTHLGEQEARRRNAPSTGRVGAPPHPLNEEERERRRLAMYEEENLGERPGDRRVQIIFLDPDEFPLLGTPMLCHPTPDAGACKPELCKLYDQKFFEFRRLSAEPQRGKIEIIERTVMRDKRLFIDEEQELVEEVSGDFTPILGEKVRILVRVTPPYVPFEGTLRMLIGRRTNDEQAPITLVAQSLWLDIEGRDQLSLTCPTLLVLEWDGHASCKVAREYSDRDIHDENLDKMVFIPMMGMKKGERVKHGPYFIERIQLGEKDGAVATQVALDEEDQNRFAMAVTLVVTLCFTTAADAARPLNSVGFGTTGDQHTVPFARTFLEAVGRRVRYHLRASNLRTMISRGAPAHPIGLHVEVSCETPWPGDSLIPRKWKGYAFVKFKLVRHNLFLWYEVFDSTEPDDADPPQERKYDAGVYLQYLLEDTIDDEASAACLHAFGDTGYPGDRRATRVRETFLGQVGATEYLVLAGSPNELRVTDSSGAVRGQVTTFDESNVQASVDTQTGTVLVESQNLLAVPAQRAAAIQAALNAITSYAAFVTTHEVGHLLGATASIDSRGSGSFPMPDGSGTGPYMKQDDGGHDMPVTMTGMMVAGNYWPMSQMLGNSGPVRTFRTVQIDYLRAVMPYSADYYPSEDK